MFHCKICNTLEYEANMKDHYHSRIYPSVHITRKKTLSDLNFLRDDLLPLKEEFDSYFTGKQIKLNDKSPAQLARINHLLDIFGG